MGDALPEQQRTVFFVGLSRPAIADDEVAAMAELEGQRPGMHVARIIGRRHEPGIGDDDRLAPDQPPIAAGGAAGPRPRRVLRLNGNDDVVRHLAGAVEIGGLAGAQRNRIERDMHGIEQIGELVAVDVGLAQQRLAQCGQLDDELQLHLGRARAMQPVLIDLRIEQRIDPLEARGDLLLAVLIAQRHTEQRQSRHQCIHRIVGERRAQLQRLDLRAQRARDDPRILGIGAFDQNAEMPQPVEDAAGGERQPPELAVEAAVARNPVERQRPGEGALLVGPRVAKVPQPGEGLKVVQPVIVDHVDGKGRGAIGVDELVGEQIAPRHHLEQGLAVGRTELGERVDVVFGARPGPAPAHKRIGHGKVTQPFGAAARKESYRVSQPTSHPTRPAARV